MRLILHIGQHKTGSKALQTALHANPELLATAGYFYPSPLTSGDTPPRAWERNHHALFVALRRRVEMGCAGDLPPAAQTNTPAALSETLRALLRQTRDPGQTVILSSEDLFDMHTAHECEFDAGLVSLGARALGEACRELRVAPTLVCYLRRQDHALAAHYTQFIKGTQAHYMPLWRYLPRFAARFDYAWMIACWEQVFGAEAIKLRSYDHAAADGGIVRDFFTEILGITPPAPVVTDDPEAANISPSRDHVEYMRILNRRSSAGGSVLPRSSVLRSALRDPRPGAGGPAAWLSTKARALLLSRYASGNARLAERYADVSALADLSIAGDLETPPPPDFLADHRLIELDSLSRAAAQRSPAGLRKAIFIQPPSAHPLHQSLARDILLGILGDPQTAPVILTRWTAHSALRHWRETAMLVLSAPLDCGFTARRALDLLRCRGTPIVLCVGSLPSNKHEHRSLQTLLRHVSLLLCSEASLASALCQPLPLGARPETRTGPAGNPAHFSLGQQLLESSKPR